jgi:hypothetical protein
MRIISQFLTHTKDKKNTDFLCSEYLQCLVVKETPPVNDFAVRPICEVFRKEFKLKGKLCLETN